jgi:hypothetical protein
VSHAELVEIAIGPDKFGRDPGPGLPRSNGKCAVLDHSSKVAIDRESKQSLPPRTFEAARDMKVGEVEDRSLLWAIPWQRNSFDMPGKDSETIRPLEILGCQRVTETDDVFGVIKVFVEKYPFGKRMRSRIGE